MLGFFFFKLLPNLINFISYEDCIGKITPKSIRPYPLFYSKKDLKLVKNRFFLVKKLEIQVIISKIMPTRSSKRIFNPMRYTLI